MSTGALICIVLGIVIIVARGPLAIAPTATLEFYRRIFATDARVRGLGVVVVVLGVGLATAGPEATGMVAMAAVTFGAALALFALVSMLAIPSLMRRLASGVFDVASSMDQASLRAVGVLAVLIGVALIYAGGWVL